MSFEEIHRYKFRKNTKIHFWSKYISLNNENTYISFCILKKYVLIHINPLSCRSLIEKKRLTVTRILFLPSNDDTEIEGDVLLYNQKTKPKFFDRLNKDIWPWLSKLRNDFSSKKRKADPYGSLNKKLTHGMLLTEDR